LTDWRRLNVAITRARRGLIVIGNRDTLVHDPHWADFVSFIEAKELVVDVSAFKQGLKVPSNPRKSQKSRSPSPILSAAAVIEEKEEDIAKEEVEEPENTVGDHAEESLTSQGDKASDEEAKVELEEDQIAHVEDDDQEAHEADESAKGNESQPLELVESSLPEEDHKTDEADTVDGMDASLPKCYNNSTQESLIDTPRIEGSSHKVEDDDRMTIDDPDPNDSLRVAGGSLERHSSHSDESQPNSGGNLNLSQDVEELPLSRATRRQVYIIEDD